MKSKMSIRSLQLSFLAIAIAALASCKKDNSASIATVTTNLTITNITGVSASGGGAVTDDKGETVTARGLCWSTNVNPSTKDSLTKDGSGAGTFTSTMSNLQPNTTYYVRAYATNSAGTGYGNAVSFTTKKLPVLTTTAATNITPNSASSGGEVTDDGGQTITERGVCWSTNPKPTTVDSKITASGTTGVFTASLVALMPNTTYYARAYATNAAGTGYGAAVSFTTIAPYAPVLTTLDATLISNTTATVGGNITDDGGQTITERGICYSNSGTPSITDSKTADANGGSGIFNVNLSGLTANTTFYSRAYATNASGTSYGNLVNFKTAVTPTTITDYDGNIYHTVTIGTQTWMVENLKVTHYRDGSAIPNVTSNTTWSSLSSGAWCDYNNSTANGTTYGHLYNWYAVNDSRIIAPTGWHVPSDAEWTVLENYLIANGYNYDGTTTENKLPKALASKSNWTTSTVIGSIGYDLISNNKSGLNALPAGYRGRDGICKSILLSAAFWTNTTSDTQNAHYRSLDYNLPNEYISSTYKLNGHTVRCIKD